MRNKSICALTGALLIAFIVFASGSLVGCGQSQVTPAPSISTSPTSTSSPTPSPSASIESYTVAGTITGYVEVNKKVAVRLYSTSEVRVANFNDFEVSQSIYPTTNNSVDYLIDIGKAG